MMLMKVQTRVESNMAVTFVENRTKFDQEILNISVAICETVIL